MRAICFDKTPDANWKVPGHQDLMVAVRASDPEARGYRAWSVKALLAVRIHLDDCGPDNGPLRVIPGSHCAGRLNDVELLRHSRKPVATCTGARGDVVLMRPLLVHAWSAATAPVHRRVICCEI